MPAAIRAIGPKLLPRYGLATAQIGGRMPTKRASDIISFLFINYLPVYTFARDLSHCDISTVVGKIVKWCVIAHCY